MSKKNATKIFDNYFTGSAYYEKRDRLRLRDGEIINNGTLMAYIHEGGYDDFGDYTQQTYLVMTMQDYKSQPSWKRDKQDLINVAIENGIQIIFVPELDIGFGLEQNKILLNNVIPVHNILEDYLIKAAKFSKEDVKTAVAAIIPGDTYKPDEIVAIAYNQRDFNDEVIHAEKVLTDYLMSLNEYHSINEYVFVSILEPCYNCLKAMLDCKASKICWAYNHKDKWETDEYIQLTNDIWAPNIRHPITNKKIMYFKVLNPKVDKFMEKNKEKLK